jgi:hypothetical protein
MTKYLTTYEELNANIGKRVEFYNYTEDTQRYGSIGIDEGNIEICGFDFYLVLKCAEELLSKYSIELIEEDNQESMAGKWTVVNDGEMLIPQEPNDNINHPNHYQLEINNKLVDVNTILEAISKKLDDKCDLMTWNYFSNATEYLLRSFFKGQQLSDLKKAKTEIEFMINKLEK